MRRFFNPPPSRDSSKRHPSSGVLSIVVTRLTGAKTDHGHGHGHGGTCPCAARPGSLPGTNMAWHNQTFGKGLPTLLAPWGSRGLAGPRRRSLQNSRRRHGEATQEHQSAEA
ncbi:hypothetical protein XA68_15450 [Ophiocordyceps unilateralis]|uniref:Uncharacterized protein n=1 Tax=Ophiocordyceps unilateralis TaxID=268505 RepID=A0A2A9PLC4_OPHUN|nr:hypothetical protein XA68_15450 [Ophiocordyceps unilateralis]